MKLTQDIKNNILKMNDEKKSIKEIIDTLKISKATVYRVIKNNNDISIISKSIKEVSNESQENLNTDSETETDTKTKSETETETETEEEGKQISFIEANESENKVFNQNEFKNELNNISRETIKPNIPIIQPNKIKDLDNSIITVKKYNNIKNNESAIINKNSIIDTLKNCNVGNVDELKLKRSTIIIIRQYINTFEEQLKNIYINKSLFEKKLFTLTIDQLQVILEDIRIQLNLIRNKDVFMNVIENSLRGLEKVSFYSGYNIDGITDDLMADNDFMMDLQIISCEVDISKYVNCKTSALLKLFRKCYQKNTENEIKNKINNVINDKDKLQQIINLK